MKFALAALTAAALCLGTASAQQIAANDGYRVCPSDMTQLGISVVNDVCGTVNVPELATTGFTSMSQLKAAMAKRDSFRTDVNEYGQCVTKFINSYRRPGADANSKAPDQAACAHSWAEDQSTQLVRDFGKACIEFSNKTMMDSNLADYEGRDCYLSAGSGRG